MLQALDVGNILLHAHYLLMLYIWTTLFHIYIYFLAYRHFYYSSSLLQLNAMLI